MGPTVSDLLAWWIELSPEHMATSWQQSQTQATPLSQRRSFLNHLCVAAFLPWFQHDYAAAARLWPHQGAVASMWELVNGTAIAFGSLRGVLLPTEAMDGAELEIPQEWVDLPQWAADYYLAVQIDLDGRWLRVWGYATHDQVKRADFYDRCDRTYCIPQTTLIQDLNAFWVSSQRSPQFANRDALAPLATLSDTTFDTLIHQLSQPNCHFPRLKIPFHQWAALIAQDQQRQQLYHARLAQTTAGAANIIHLNRWFQDWVDREWQSLTTFLNHPGQPLTPSLRTVASNTPQRFKWIELPVEPETKRTLLLVTLSKSEIVDHINVTIQLHPDQGQPHVPPGITLTIYADTDELNVSARHDDTFIQLPRFTCSPGTHFSLKISLDTQNITEHFMV